MRNDTKTFLRGLLAAGVIGGATLGFAGVAGAEKPADGTAGNAEVRSWPKGQYENDHNRGHRCDDNRGVGQGNPAFAGCDDTTDGPGDGEDDGTAL